MGRSKRGNKEKEREGKKRSAKSQFKIRRRFKNQPMDVTCQKKVPWSLLNTVMHPSTIYQTICNKEQSEELHDLFQANKRMVPFLCLPH
jgi:hypothetical protein